MMKKIITICCVCIIVGIIVIGWLFIQGNQQGITMGEGKIIADAIVNDMGIDYYFTGASGHIDLRNGYFSDWGYSYYIISNQTFLEIRVFETTDPILDYHAADNSQISNINNCTIDSWNYDSPDAIDISNTNDEVKAFLNRYNTEITLMQLKHPDMVWDSVEINREVWYIRYSRIYHLDDPKTAEIYIDANTGEVLYVHADD